MNTESFEIAEEVEKPVFDVSKNYQWQPDTVFPRRG